MFQLVNLLLNVGILLFHQVVCQPGIVSLFMLEIPYLFVLTSSVP